MVVQFFAIGMFCSTFADNKKLKVTTIGPQIELSQEAGDIKTEQVKNLKQNKKHKSPESNFFKNFFNRFKRKPEKPEDKLNNHIKERIEMIEKKISEKQKQTVEEELPVTKKTDLKKKPTTPKEVKPLKSSGNNLKTTTTSSKVIVKKQAPQKKTMSVEVKGSIDQKPISSQELKAKQIKTPEEKKPKVISSPEKEKSSQLKQKQDELPKAKDTASAPKAVPGVQKKNTKPLKQAPSSEKALAETHPLLSILKKASMRAPELMGSLSNYKISQFEEQLQKASDRHNLSLISSWSTEQDQSPNNVDSLTEGRVGLRFQKNLWDPPAKSRIESAEYNAREKKALLEVQKQIFYERTCRLYLNLFRMENTLELAKLNRGVNFDNYIATNDRYQEGELTRTDKELASTRFNVSKAVLVDAEYQREITQAEFKKITGLSIPNELVYFDIDSNHILMKEIVSGNQQSIYFPEMAALAALESQEKLYEVSKYNQWPILSLTAESAFLEETGSLATRVEWEHSIGLNFTIPLYSGGALRFDREREWARVKVMESQLEITRREKQSEIDRILATLRYNESLKKHYGKAEKAADEMVKGFREEYRVGTRTSTDLLDAENERFTVKVRRLNSELDLTLSKISLLRVFGLLDHETLARLIVAVPEAQKK
jgi:outer membrane protein